MKIETLKNTSDYVLFLNGIDCYMTIRNHIVPNHRKKSDFASLLSNKPNFIVLLNNDTVKKYTKKFNELGFKMVEQIPYNSFETQMYFEGI